MLITKHYFLPEDYDQFKLDNKSLDMGLALSNFSESLHQKIRNKSGQYNEEQIKILEEVQKELLEELDNYKVDLDDLIY